MKNVRSIFCILISCVLLGGLPIRAAAEKTSFDLIPCAPEEEAKIRANMKNFVVLADSPASGYIYSFAIREDGWMVYYVASKQIDIYNEKGEFQYGYTVGRGPYKVDWSNGNVLIAVGGDPIVIIVDSQGKATEIAKTRKGDLDPYWHVIESYQKEVSGTIYRMRHSVKILEKMNVMACIDQIVRVEPDGTETILVDMRDRMPLVVRYAWFLFPLAALLIIVFFIYQQIENGRKKK